MEKKRTIKWGFICAGCGHEVDNHSATRCEQVIRTEYEDSSFMLMTPMKVTKRIICDCGDLSLKRVKVSDKTEWE